MQRRTFLAGASFAALSVGAYFLAPGGNAGFGLAAAKAQTADVDTSIIPDMVLGSDDAPITVIEYASYTCPHCRNFHANVFEQLKSNYIDTGKIRFIYREVYFDRFGLWASMVARCGGEAKFFGITDLLYKGQKEWTASGDPATIAGNLRTIGLTAGLSAEDLDACMSDGDMAQTLVTWFQENAEKDDVSSTPTFIVDGEKQSNMSYADFSALLDKKLGI